jgi:hypothetical protein
MPIFGSFPLLSRKVSLSLESFFFFCWRRRREEELVLPKI